MALPEAMEAEWEWLSFWLEDVEGHRTRGHVDPSTWDIGRAILFPPQGQPVIYAPIGQSYPAPSPTAPKAVPLAPKASSPAPKLVARPKPVGASRPQPAREQPPAEATSCRSQAAASSTDTEVATVTPANAGLAQAVALPREEPGPQRF